VQVIVRGGSLRIFGGNKVGEQREGGERNLPGLGTVSQSDVAREATESKKEEATRAAKPRYEAIDREQLCWRVVDVERLIGEEHPARAIWEFVGKLDLSGYSEENRAVEGQAGRPAWEPRLLISLWVYGYSEGVGSGRAIEQMCEWEPAYQWLTGGRVVNAHTLTDFRAKHEKALKELFVQILGLLSVDGLITLERVMQDGTKIRASAAADSFRRKEGVEQALKQAAQQVAAVEEMGEEETSRRAAKARQRAQRERKERLEKALEEFEKLVEEGSDKDKRRVSTSDPQARVMKQADGGFGPSYNVQLSTDAANALIVGVEVVQAGNDFEQLESGIERVKQNLGKTPKEVVSDGGFVSGDNIVAMKKRGIEFIGPCVDEVGKGQSSYERRGVSPAYHSSQFVYEATSDSYRCPQGKVLSYEGKEERHMQVSYRYRAARSDCQGCPVKSQCCPGNRVTGRSIHRSEELAEVAEFRQRMQSERAREIYRQRAQVAETPNLWIKAKFGLRQFSLRGLSKVRMEALWVCLTYNIRVWIRLCWRLGAPATAAV
jgi:transposase